MTGALGSSAVAVAFGGILASTFFAPWLSLTEHALSDLGEVGRATAPIFNLLLLLGGALGCGFVFATVLHVVSWLSWAILSWPGDGIAVPDLVGAAALGLWALRVAADAAQSHQPVALGST